MEKFGLIFIVAIFFSCSSQEPFSIHNEKQEKINGLSLVSENRDIEQKDVSSILDVNCNYAAVIPFGFIPALNKPFVSFDSKWQWKGEKTEGTIHSINLLHENGIKVMVKPQIWVGHGEFTGKIEMNSEEDWQELEKSYLAYILTYAEIAEKNKVEIFCIGTELNRFVMARSHFWNELIVQVRAVYSGKLTYAENWDSYSKVPFWNSLDYIGVDAYFPISSNEAPSLNILKRGWESIKQDLQKVSGKFKKQILFSEFGYRSIDNCAESPWDFNVTGKEDQDAQNNALEALFSTVWNEDYMAGGFLWKWYPRHSEAGGVGNTKFTVQNKKAESLIRKVYGQ